MRIASVVLLLLLLLLSFTALAAAVPDESHESHESPHHVAGIDLREIEQPYTTAPADLGGADADAGPSTWHFALVFYWCGLLGMLAHYAKKWARGQYAGNLWAYLFADNPRASLVAIITYTGSAAAVIATGSIAGMSVPQVAALGFGVGYAIDSAVNRT